ncbi:MbnP family protein, partial [Chitinophaga sp.]|uniref:MbnP family protein n=1 Tax=Chitinophaga sp. TaxID=1869181 RepID=UPI002F91DDE1
MILRIFASYACWFLVIAALFAWMPAGPEPVPSLQLSFTHLVGQQPLLRNQATYTNASGETFTISRFRYFLSNFSL